MIYNRTELSGTLGACGIISELSDFIVAMNTQVCFLKFSSSIIQLLPPPIFANLY